MTTYTYEPTKPDWLLWEAGGYHSRSTVTATVPATGMKTGQMVGMITATNKMVPHNPGASDGSEVVRGLLFATLDEPGDQQAVIIARSANVHQNGVIPAQSATQQQITDAFIALNELGIVTRS